MYEENFLVLHFLSQFFFVRIEHKFFIHSKTRTHFECMSHACTYDEEKMGYWVICFSETEVKKTGTSVGMATLVAFIVENSNYVEDSPKYSISTHILFVR